MTKERSKSRYVMREQVGSGDYAKVYAAEDTKLGRSVAVKQLHRQYIDDEEKLDRYWREAQMLVDLEHPNIMTIYDVVKPRGCLVLELMKGNLKQVYGKKPMPVNEVRETLLQAARGLDCLHSNGIIHGDIKPANLMLSRQDVVKLGDFGLARRANDEEGSLLKGTTKYMAPELVSEDFGDVGPASDLYSLGFSALELMIGPEFDSLFPDLIAFGRDTQMAWMMWHCSADRHFPPIQSVLEGVPDDLASVLQKLTSKDQKRRYKSAKELIADLTGGANQVGESIREDEAAAIERVRKLKRKRRFRAIGACVASLILTLSIVILANWETPAPVIGDAKPAIRGVVQNVLPHDQKFVLDVGNDFREIKVHSNEDVQLNRKTRQVRDLQIGDRVVVREILGEPGTRPHQEIIAFRPETHSALVTGVNAEAGKLTIAVSDGEDAGQNFELVVSDETQFILNRQSESASQPLGLSSLAKDDRVIVDLSDDESGMLALKIDALRQIGLSGVIRKLNPRSGSITIAESVENGEEKLVTLPIDANCVFTLNGLTAIDEKLLNVKDIQIGDRVALKHDIKIQSIDAYRAFEDRGRIVDIAYEDNQFTLKSQTATASKRYLIDAKTQVLLGDQVVGLAALRIGDTVQLVHESPDDQIPKVVSLNAIRPADRSKWAILIANQEFDSAVVKPMTTCLADVESIKNQLIGRFGVPENQLTVYENEGRVRLESEIPNLLRRVGSDDILYVFVATRGFNDKDRNAYLATKEFSVANMETTGIGLDWLIDQLDAIPTRQKLLMLDCCAMGTDDPQVSVSATEMVEIVRQNKRGGFPRSTYVLTSCLAGDQTLTALDCPDNGLFGKCLSDAFAGSADKERDMDVEITELTTFVTDQVVAQAKSQNASQTPKLFIPNDSPPRLSDQAIASIIELLSRLEQKRLSTDSIMSAANDAQRLSGDEPEPMMACGLLLIKAGQVNEALEILENIRLRNRGYLVADQAVIWIHFYKRHYKLGTSKLVEMLRQIPKPEKKGETYSEDDLDRFEWAGQLRELAASVDWTARTPDPGDLEACDQVVNSHGELPSQRYESGRKKVKQISAQFLEDLKQDPKSNSVLERQQIDSYVPPIASPETVAAIRRGMEKR